MIASEFPFWFALVAWLIQFSPFYPAIVCSISAACVTLSRENSWKKKRDYLIATAILWGAGFGMFAWLW